MRFYRTTIGLLVLHCVLVACSAQVQRQEADLQPAMTRYQDQFWQDISADVAADWFYLLGRGEDALTWRLTMIDSARHQIDMETFLWKNDEAGQAVLAHLLAAADRGVSVRMLLDDSFTPDQDLLLSRIEHHPNIQLRIYNPFGYRHGGMLGRTAFNLSDFQRVNHRLHNKTLIVDGWAANVGGRNLADEYFGLHSEYNFRDMEVLALGESVASASEHFAAFWNSPWSVPISQLVDIGATDAGLQTLRARLESTLGAVDVAGDPALQARWQWLAAKALPGEATFLADPPAAVDGSGEAQHVLGRELVGLINAAREDVVMVSAYLVPTIELGRAIADARERGVRVRILTNSMRSNNHLAAHAAYAGYIKGLLLEGVELYELRIDAIDRGRYMRAPVKEKALGLHAKFLLFDDELAFIGSSNLDARSLKLNTEVGLLIHSKSLNTRIREEIEADFDLANAWRVELTDEGAVVWRGKERTYPHPPEASSFQLLEDWFIGLLPIDGNM